MVFLAPLTPEFTKWLNGPTKTLFCPGIPGAGKTTITAIVIDQLLKVVWSDAVGVAYVTATMAKVDQNAAGLLAAKNICTSSMPTEGQNHHLKTSSMLHNWCWHTTLERTLWSMLRTSVRTKMALATNFWLHSAICKQNKSVRNGYFVLRSHHSERASLTKS